MYLEIGGVCKWQNAISAARALPLVLKSATHTEDQTEPGNQMLEKSKLLSMAILSQSTFVHVACVPERLHARFDFMDLTEEQQFLCFFHVNFHKYFAFLQNVCYNVLVTWNYCSKYAVLLF